MQYKGPRGLIIKNANTGRGWKIRNLQDLETALYMYPAFETVYSGFILEALEQALKERKEYENVEDLANFLMENYI